MVKNPSTNAEKARDAGLENSMQRSLVDYSPGSQCLTRLPESDTTEHPRTEHARTVYGRPPEVPDLPVGSLASDGARS